MQPLALALAVALAADPSPASENLVRSRALIPGVLAASTLVIGGIFLTVGELQWEAAGRLPSEPAVDDARRIATSNVVGGVGLLGFGALMAGLTTVMLLWTPSPRAGLAIVPTRGGLALSVSWVWP